jgi:hypothetical protein
MTDLCPCGHAKDRHEIEVVHESYGGWWSGVAKEEDFAYIYCLGDEDPQGDPCSGLEHVI